MSMAVAHVEDIFSREVVTQYPFEHERCRFVMAGTECHFGVDDDFIPGFGHVGVESAVYDTFVAYDDGLEVVFFPLFVPILVGIVVARPFDFGLDRQMADDFKQCRFGILVFGNVGAHAGSVGNKAVVTGFHQ